jgi:hypothetical protein
LKLATRFKVWFRRKRRNRAARRRRAALREFVYLDEVSIFSLLASRLGPIATEFTENQRASLKAEVGGVGSSVEAGSQVLRKSTVQTSFKELYELETDSLMLRPIDHKTKRPKVDNIHDVILSKEVLIADGWIIDPENLSRGNLIEAEVQLEASDIFRVSSVLATILEIIDENPEMFGVEGPNLTQGKAAGRVLDKLLVGLVPVSGVAIDYQVIAIENKEWILHRKLLSGLSDRHSLQSYPLYIVGVAEQSLFWKDVRRVLFSNARFRVLCRLAQDALKNSWTPVKLAHILDLVKPGLGDQIDTLGSVVLASMVNASTADQTTDRRELVRNALIRYAMLLGEHYKQEITVTDLTTAGLLSDEQCDNFYNFETRRGAFNHISSFLKQRFDGNFDPLVVAQYRMVALVEAGLDPTGKPLPTGTSTAAPPSVVEKRFLDSEFVAIYW